jgi:hypothetical protein
VNSSGEIKYDAINNMRQAESIIIIKWLKNLIGDRLHYETCPNCGDSWWWKPAGGIAYKSEGNNLFEVMICKECLQNPARLNFIRIEKDLLKREWKQLDIKLARTAIINFKVRKTRELA